MRARRLITGLFLGGLLAAAPAFAHKSEREVARKPVSPASQTVQPQTSKSAPKICLFSENGKSAASTRASDKASSAKTKSADAKSDQARPSQQPRERVCEIAAPPAPVPLG
jgi:hypothetical protein